MEFLFEVKVCAGLRNYVQLYGYEDILSSQAVQIIITNHAAAMGYSYR